MQRGYAFFGEFDGALIHDAAYRAIWAENLAAVIDQPDGYVLDNLAWGGDWDVDPAEVVAPTVLWFGEDDRHCPPSHGRWYNERIAGSQLIIVPGIGHVDVIDGRWPETLAGVLLEAIDGAKQPDAKEGWRQRGAAFFQRRARTRKGDGKPAGDDTGAAADGGGHGPG